MSRPHLRALARACGILDEYRATDGSPRRVTDTTREALVRAMGIDASSERAAAEALRAQEEHERSRCLDAVEVVRVERRWRLRGRAPRTWHGRTATWLLHLALENGDRAQREGTIRIGSDAAFAIPGPPLPRGVHEVRLHLECDGGQIRAIQCVFAAPRGCVAVERQLGQSRAYGIWAHLYALARPDDFGVGDLGHLKTLVDFAAQEGAAFVATQPFHALGNTGRTTSPYSPTSRLFRNPIYLDLEAVPEFRETDEGKRALRGFELCGKLETLRTSSRLDYGAVMHVKRSVLERLFRAFRAERGSTERRRAYDAYVEREGDALQAFSTYCALADRFGGTYSPATDWRSWRSGFHDPRSAEVREFVRAQPVGLEFHCWLQFEMDRQLSELGARAKTRLPLGLVGDLALGSGRGSADTWMQRGLFVEGASLGAPPDAFADGQDWDLPPLHPLRSREDGHAYWRRVLRTAFRSVGALRVDHVMGVFRQFWIPAGRPAAEGAYLEMPARELLALLAIESHRAGAVVIGEDLGTRPAALSPRLARAGILSTRVLPFERTGGGFRPASRYGSRAYVTGHTHDLPPLRGWRAGRDLELRHEAGGLEEPGALEASLEERSRQVAALRRRLARDRCLPGGSEPLGDEEFASAVTAFLGSTAAPLLALSVNDLAGERDPLNLPAVPTARYPNWAHRMNLSVEALRDHPTARAILAAIPADRRLGECNAPRIHGGTPIETTGIATSQHR